MQCNSTRCYYCCSREGVYHDSSWFSRKRLFALQMICNSWQELKISTRQIWLHNSLRSPRPVNEFRTISASIEQPEQLFEAVFLGEQGWRSGESARLPPMCPGFDSRGPGVICGLSLLLVLYSAPRGFSPGTPVFPSPQKSTFSNSNSIWECMATSERVLWAPWCSVGKQITFTFLHFYIYPAVWSFFGISTEKLLQTF